MSITIDLSGRVALVTGGSGELGRTICRRLAEGGADVAVHYHRSRDKAEAVAAAVRALGRKACCVTGDVADADAIAAMRDAIAADLGAPHIVVANAVQQYDWTSVLEQSIDDFQSQYDTCVKHVVLLAQAFVPAMIERGGGRFIGTNTECAMQCHPSQGAYVSGKRGMDGVLRVLAREIGAHQITVNQVAPGWMISDRQRASGEEKQPAYDQHVPLKRRGDDMDIANAVAFLASDLAGFITGCYLPVCGGDVMPTI